MKLLNYKYVAITLIAIPIVLVAIKFLFWGYSFEKILPKNSYEVELVFSFEGNSEPTNISCFIPENNLHQTIYDEVNFSPELNFQIQKTKNGKIALWSDESSYGNKQFSYQFSVMGQQLKYDIDPSLSIPPEYAPSILEYLQPTENIQSKHPFIIQLHDEIVGDKDTIIEILHKVFDHCYNMGKKPFKGVTDALTAARLNEASCNGKSRLFVALCQRSKLPARLVGGIILKSGSKKTSHQWVEVFVEGIWVPFDALNNHFATLPSNYLKLYTGDKFLLKHTPNINFQYLFNIKKELANNPLLINQLKSNIANAYLIWEAFEKVGIPLELLKIILLLPLGALVVAIFRNVIGIKTFGVFLPALIAIASQETGLFYGLAAFLLVVLIVSLIHFPLDRLGLLYTPKMVIMLVGVVISFIFISGVGIWMNIPALAYVTLFPIVVITITAERFAKTIIEEGYLDALRITLQTLFVASVAYFVMNSTSMEAFFLAFPELFLTIIGVNILLGRWIGLRLTEYSRFKFIIS